MGPDDLRARRVDLPDDPSIEAWALNAPPAMCVLAARLGGFGEPPDLVVSGINPGCNTGRAVLHSGTVGAALTAANFGGRGLAVSLDVPGRLDPSAPRHWRTAAAVAAAAIDWLAEAGPGVVLNLNVPDRPPERLAGARAATLAPFGTVRSAV